MGMRVAICAARMRTMDVEENIATIRRSALRAKCEGAQIICFGEAFLQGFDACIFDYAVDILRAVALHSPEMAAIAQIARDLKIAIGLGFYENAEGGIYSSYAVWSAEGKCLHVYRRVSEGWKERWACADYREGRVFSTFPLGDCSIGIALCGDLWEDALLSEIVEMEAHADLLLWPVHCDYTEEEWNGGLMQAYAERTAVFDAPVAFCNNDMSETSRAHGGAYLWHHGRTYAASPYGREGMILFDVAPKEVVRAGGEAVSCAEVVFPEDGKQEERREEEVSCRENIPIDN